MMTARPRFRARLTAGLSLLLLLSCAGGARGQAPWGVLGTVIEGAARAMDRFGMGVSAAYTSYKSLRVECRYQRGEIDCDQRLDAHYRYGFGLLGGLGGGSLGGTAGAFLGSTLGPPGTLLGGLVGGFCGAYLGERFATRNAGRCRQVLCHGRELLGAAAERLGGRVRRVVASVKGCRPVQALRRIADRGRADPPP